MWPDLLMLVVAGLAGGFVGGLVGVGGGLIFAPVLFFYFSGVGVSPELVTPLTIGTSLMCTLVVALFSAKAQLNKNAVELKTAIFVGIASALAAVLMTTLVTTKPWYDASVFQIVFAALLFVVAAQMIFGRRMPDRVPSSSGENAVPDPVEPPVNGKPGRVHRPIEYLLAGTTAGAVATAAGVGGGIVLVPLYRRILHFPIHRAVGTSSATIVLISLAGMASYMVSGRSLHISPYSVGFVDIGRALALSVPAAFTARLGVRSAHRLDQRRLNQTFAAVAVLVALRMLLRATGLF